MVKLHELNAPQREAVITVDGPLLVLAGAGSGKTRVITYRVAHLLDLGLKPERLLAVSFTNKAADEMRERVQKLVGKSIANRLTLCTFHALGLQILKSEKNALGMKSGFTIYDSSDQLGLIRELCKRVQLDDRRLDAKAIQYRISLAKNAFLSPEEYAENVGDHEYDILAAELYPKYQESLRTFHAFDFDDLIVEPVRLFERDAEARERWASTYSHVMVDEYQDTNRAQSNFLRHLVPHHNLCVVGDDDQSIYGWRGAEAGHILEFESHFKGAKVVRLEENYRSTPQILNAANAVIANNKKRHKKTLWTARAPGEKLKIVVADDAEGEAKFIAEEIEVLRATRGMKPTDFAVLYRSNIQSKLIEEAFRTQRIAYKVVGGQAFFDRKEVKDAIAYLRLLIAPRDEMSLRRIINYPARGIGPTTVERLQHFAESQKITLYDAAQRANEIEELGDRGQNAVRGFCDLMMRGLAELHSGKPLREAAENFFKDTGLQDEILGSGSPKAAEKRLANLSSFFDSIARFDATQGKELARYLQLLTLRTNDDDSEADENQEVILTTLHGSKGLEFPVVFLVGVEEELLPHKRTLAPIDSDVLEETVDLGEERRLMYVGITRARELLYLTRAKYRTARASQKPRTPSRFLDEIPAELYDTLQADVPQLSSPADEEAFARASLAKLLSMTLEDEAS